MARSVDLTGKLGMDGKPTISIGGTVLEVQNGAREVLRIMEMVGDDGDMSPADMLKAEEILLGKEGSRELGKLALSFADYTTVLTTALELAAGSAEGEAEATPATTS